MIKVKPQRQHKPMREPNVFKQTKISRNLHIASKIGKLFLTARREILRHTDVNSKVHLPNVFGQFWPSDEPESML